MDPLAASYFRASIVARARFIEDITMDLIQVEPCMQVHLLGDHLDRRRLAQVFLSAGE